MRTTLDIEDSLLAAARETAASRSQTLTSIVEEALAALLTPRAAEGAPFRLEWRSHAGSTLPGVDVADRDALFDRMGEMP